MEDSGWWEGAPGAGLQIGEYRYTPAVAGASLTLAAVYDNGGQACYWLAASEGDIVEEGALTQRWLPELLIAQAAEDELGEAAAVVGRLSSTGREPAREEGSRLAGVRDDLSG